MSTADPPATIPAGAPAKLASLGILSVEGPEARAFLQGQLSCDTVKLARGSWCWGGYLTPKGRVVATFVACAVGDERIDLIMDAKLVAATKKQLGRYLLRAKAKLEASAEPVAATLDGAFGGEPAFVAQLTPALALAIGVDAACDPVADAFVHALFAAEGMPWLCAELSEQLTAHMLSLDLAGGVDFAKGCYVGQEIVIRAHHRGAIKKRAYVVQGAGVAPPNGEQVMSPLHEGQVVGQVIYAAQVAEGFVAFASIRKDAAAAGVELGDGRAITALAPPYGLIDPKFEK